MRIKKGDEKFFKKEKHVYSTCRRAYFLIYLLVISIIFFLITTWVKEIPTPPYILLLAIFTCFMLIKTTELHRFRENCVITSDSVTVNKGIFSVKSKRVDHVAISEVVVYQNLLQRIINVGDINIFAFSNEKTQLNITNLDNPRKIADLIEYHMMNAKVGKKEENENSKD